MKPQIFNFENWMYCRYDGRKKLFRGISREDFRAAYNKNFQRATTRNAASDFDGYGRRRRARYLAAQYLSGDRYGKLPTFGHTHLYLCAPEYGLRDYNKAQILEIRGHERYCAVLSSYYRRKYQEMQQQAAN